MARAYKFWIFKTDSANTTDYYWTGAGWSEDTSDAMLFDCENSAFDYWGEFLEITAPMAEVDYAG